MNIGIIMITLIVGYIIFLFIYNQVKKNSKLTTFSVVVYDINGKWVYSKYVEAKDYKNAKSKVNSKLKFGQSCIIKEL